MTAQEQKVPPQRRPKKRRRAGPRAPYRIYLTHEKIKMIFLAGEGKSAAEIAEVLGGSNASKIRSILHKMGVPLSRKGGHDDRILIKCTTPERAAIRKMADGFDMEEGLFLLTLGMILTSEPEVVAGLMEDQL